MRDSGKDLVAAHADHAPQLIDFDIDAVLFQRLRPRVRVRAVAVDQCAIDIEQQGFETAGDVIAQSGI